jgi:hypothetical protein
MVNENSEKICGPVKENGVRRIHIDQVLMDLYREPDIISEIGKGRLEWLGYLARMPEETTVKKVFKNIAGGKGSAGKPRKKWLDDVKMI